MMKSCPECGTETSEHPLWCQTGATEYEDLRADFDVPINDHEEEID